MQQCALRECINAKRLFVEVHTQLATLAQIEKGWVKAAREFERATGLRSYELTVTASLICDVSPPIQLFLFLSFPSIFSLFPRFCFLAPISRALFFSIDSICLCLIDWARSSSISPSSILLPIRRPVLSSHSCSRNRTNNAVNVFIASGYYVISCPRLSPTLLSSLRRLTIPWWSWPENQIKTKTAKISSALNFRLVKHAKYKEEQITYGD